MTDRETMDEIFYGMSVEESIRWVLHETGLNRRELVGHSRTPAHGAARVLLYHVLWGYQTGISRTKLADLLDRHDSTLTHALRGRSRAEARDWVAR